MPKTRILLLTNRDSDNVGDQIIEASVISLIKGVMKNLGMSAENYSINTRAAGIISKKYMKTGDPALLEDARRTISASDILIFGGAPLFNYSYQNFYKRTIVTLELAEEYGVPVLFSSIGVEPYNPDNAKSRQLKKALELSVVRQITTRDDIDSVRKYVEGTDTPVAHVADPAVFSDLVFRPKPAPKSAPAPTPVGGRQKAIALARQVVPAPVKSIAKRMIRGGEHPAPSTTKAPTATAPKKADAGDAQKKVRRIGLIVTRSGIFADNGIEFSEHDQQKFWLDVIARLEERGDDYKLFTTGHFSDEVFLDNLIRTSGIPASKASFTVNSPEELTHQLKACDGVIAYRLHASITSYAYSIPSIGLSWNFKVPYFYESVGYGQRAVAPENWNADHVLQLLDRALVEGVHKDIPFQMSVYTTLFDGIKAIVAPESQKTGYTYEELRTKLPRYTGTSQKIYRDKVRRKFRRTFENYQKLQDSLQDAREQLEERAE